VETTFLIFGGIMLESSYQAHLIERLRAAFEGCVILKNDSSYLQGVPDLLILHNHHWAALEVKPSESARVRPNQDYYIDLLDEMSFAAYIYPENEKEVLRALSKSFGVSRTSRFSQR
jgi:hypothetical protein